MTTTQSSTPIIRIGLSIYYQVFIPHLFTPNNLSHCLSSGPRTAVSSSPVPDRSEFYPILTCILHAGVHPVVLKYKCFHSCFSIMAMLLFTPLLAFIPRLASIRAERTLIVPQTVRQVGGFSQYGCKLRNDDRRMSNLCTHDSELR